MNLLKELRYIETALDSYRTWLDTIPDEEFSATPPMGGWSYAEVYSHILKANLGCGIAIERCVNKTCGTSQKGTSLVGALMLAFGRFPPFKVKAPEPVEAAFPVSNITREDARNLIIKCRKQIDKFYPLVASAMPNYRMKHPRMGMLNAHQWFKFIRIHSQHHLKQLARIKNNFAKG